VINSVKAISLIYLGINEKSEIDEIKTFEENFKVITISPVSFSYPWMIKKIWVKLQEY
jgi:hypothetical protein